MSAPVARMFNRKAWIVGVLLIAALLVASPSPPLILIAILGVMQAVRRGEELTGPDEAEVTPSDRRWMAVKYFSLCAALAAGVWCSSVLLRS